MTSQAETWRRSSFSGASNECVEVSNRGRVRDSKDPHGPALAADMEALLTKIKVGHLDD